MSSSSPLAAVTAFRIPRSLLTETIEVLVDAGTAGQEAFVVWGGTVSDDGTSLTFTSALTPEQDAFQTPDGLLVTVDGPSLFEVNRALYARGELLAGQVHSHPTTAFHSSTDDHYPLVTLAGALSVVIPDFARHAPADIKRWAWYRLIAAGAWAPLEADDRIELLAEPGDQ